MADKILHPKKRAFLAAYVRVASITKAAEIAGISRESHYEWKASDPDYARAFEAAKQIACETLEDEAVRRAHEGVDEPVYQGGQLVGTIRKYSDTLLIFLMKGAMPEKYKDRVSNEISGSMNLIDRLASGRQRVLNEAESQR